jgi:hypothetical protein
MADGGRVASIARRAERCRGGVTGGRCPTRRPPVGCRGATPGDATIPPRGRGGQSPERPTGAGARSPRPAGTDRLPIPPRTPCTAPGRSSIPPTPVVAAATCGPGLPAGGGSSLGHRCSSQGRSSAPRACRGREVLGFPRFCNRRSGPVEHAGGRPCRSRAEDSRWGRWESNPHGASAPEVFETAGDFGRTPFRSSFSADVGQPWASS